ncbi:MAG: hypothetical protein IIY16_02035 [Oscillospiraceae bacterium]|nr:hypothetical protein [Oscillospiraceae bacterium]
MRLLFVCAFLSAFLIFIPIHAHSFAGSPLRIAETLLISINSAMRLFVMDGDFDIVLGFLAALDSPLVILYRILAALLYVLNPLLTCGFVLSFFRNITAYQKLLLHYFSDFYVFSELNDRAVTLAASLRKKHPRCQIIFCDVFDSNDEPSFEIAQRARALGSICFKKDIAAINFRYHSKKKLLCFFTIGADESENIDQSLRLINTYSDREHTRLYIFSRSAESEYLFHELPGSGIKVRRVNPIRSLVARTLYYGGEQLFTGAAPGDDGQKHICIVIAGLGQLGSEMLCSLPWLCQMDGYSVEIHAFDRDPHAASRFAARAPELVSPQLNGTDVPGEARYSITIHSGTDIDSEEFAAAIAALPKVTHVYTMLGSDEENIRAAVMLRMLCERSGHSPAIQSVVENSGKVASLAKIKNYRGMPYRIDFIGDLDSCYSEEVILDSELEEEALSRHLKWGDESSFWAYEFNYRSSIATAIHMKMRIFCGIPGADKREDALTEEERDIIERLEHRRWNAYMRADGYVYSGSRERSSRNDLAKMHPDLVPFETLSEEDKRKDSRVGTK